MNITTFSSREEIHPQFQALLDEEVSTLQKLKERIARRDQLDSQLGDDYARRYIQQSRWTENEEYKTKFMHFVEQIMPERQRINDQLNRQLMTFSYLDQLEKPYQIYLRSVKKQIDLFREENILLQEQDQKIATSYQACRAAMMLTYAGKELTLQQAGKYLEEPDRVVRKEIYELIVARQTKDTAQIHQMLDELITLRLQQATNA
jgi:oligoendopeptidase F